MKEMTYKLGQSVGRHPRAWLVGAICVVAAFAVNSRIENAKEDRRIAEQKVEEQRKRDMAAEQKAVREALVEKCTTGIDPTVRDARDAIKKNDPERALVLLKPCDGLWSEQTANLHALALEAARAKAKKTQELWRSNEKARKKSEGVRLGMTSQEALDSSWGAPERVNRTTTAWGVREQWVYGGGNYLYFTDDKLESFQN